MLAVHFDGLSRLRLSSNRGLSLRSNNLRLRERNRFPKHRRHLTLDKLLNSVRKLQIRKAHTDDQVAVFEIAMQRIEAAHFRCHDQRLSRDVPLLILRVHWEFSHRPRFPKAFYLYFTYGLRDPLRSVRFA